MDGRRGRTSRRQDQALRQRRTTGSAPGHETPPDADGPDGAAGPAVVVLPDTEQHRAAVAADERLARARESADAARASRRALQERIEEQRSRLQGARPGPAPASRTAEGEPPRAARIVPAWAGTMTADRAPADRAPADRAPADRAAADRAPADRAAADRAAADRAAAHAAPTGPPTAAQPAPATDRTPTSRPAADRAGLATPTVPPTAAEPAPATDRTPTPRPAADPAPPTAPQDRPSRRIVPTRAPAPAIGAAPSPALAKPAPSRPAPPRPPVPVEPGGPAAVGAPASAPRSDEAGPRHRLLLFVIAVVVAVVALGLIRAQQDAPFVDPAAQATDADGVAPAEGPPAGELRVQATLQEESVDVEEATRFIADQPTEVQLRLPALAGLNGPIRTAQLSVVDLQVSLDGAPVEPEQDPAQPGNWVVQRADGEPFAEMQVRYRLDGALLTNALSAPGRLLAVLGPLSSGASAGSAAVAIRGDGVMNVYCPGQAADQLLCATQNGDAWDATLPSPSPVEPVLLIQVDRA